MRARRTDGECRKGGQPRPRRSCIGARRSSGPHKIISKALQLTGRRHPPSALPSPCKRRRTRRCRAGARRRSSSPPSCSRARPRGSLWTSRCPRCCRSSRARGERACSSRRPPCRAPASSSRRLRAATGERRWHRWRLARACRPAAAARRASRWSPAAGGRDAGCGRAWAPPAPRTARRCPARRPRMGMRLVRVP